MKINKSFNWTIIITSLTIIGFLVGCAHKQAYKKALELEKSGQYAAAAEKDLEALDKKPEFEDARAHLSVIAPRAYDELRIKAENFERNMEWVQAINNWKHLDILLGRFQRYNIHLNTIDVKSKLNQAKDKGTNYYYAAGEQAFKTGQYSVAIENYKNVKIITGNYLKTEERLWECHVRLGDQALAQSDYANAVEYYKDALQYTKDASTTQPLIAEAYYRWGNKHYQEKNYREANEKYETVLKIIPNYRDTQNRRNDAYQNALQRVAILPFKNSTSQSNNKYADILTDNLLNCCIKANLKYATFVNRANLDLILEEHKLTMSGMVDPNKATQMGKMEGIHYFVTGTITQVIPKQNSPSSQDLTHSKQYSVTDSAGNTIQKTMPITYQEFSTSRSVKIVASIQIVEVETGRYVSGNNYNEDIIDDFKWVKYSGNISDLPKEKQNLVNKRPAYRSDALMIGEGLDQLSKKMGETVLAYFK